MKQNNSHEYKSSKRTLIEHGFYKNYHKHSSIDLKSGTTHIHYMCGSMKWFLKKK